MIALNDFLKSNKKYKPQTSINESESDKECDVQTFIVTPEILNEIIDNMINRHAYMKFENYIRIGIMVWDIIPLTIMNGKIYKLIAADGLKDALITMAINESKWKKIQINISDNQTYDIRHAIDIFNIYDLMVSDFCVINLYFE